MQCDALCIVVLWQVITHLSSSRLDGMSEGAGCIILWARTLAKVRGPGSATRSPGVTIQIICTIATYVMSNTFSGNHIAQLCERDSSVRSQQLNMSMQQLTSDTLRAP